MAPKDTRSRDGFVSFFRGYTKTWIHAVAAAGLTAFGTLSVYHRLFIALALAAYVVPPIALYLLRPSVGRDEGDAERESEPDRSVPPGDRGRDAGDSPPRRSESPDPAEPAETAEPAAPGGANDATRSAATEPSATRRAVEPDTDDEGAAADASEGEDEHAREWRLVDVPTEATLRDVCVTDRGTVHAVGEDGLVLSGAAVDGGDLEWSIALADGPAAEGEELQGADATADGAALWIAGDSGAVGRLEAETGRHTDHTAPRDITDNWLGVAVGGPSGDETVLLINGSGAVLRGRYRDGTVSWDEPVTPGSGSSLSGIALADATVGYCCDTNDGVFETADGGDSFTRVGLEGASGTLETVATLGRGDCFVSADDGVVHRYGGSTWTPERVGEAAICGLARREGETIACDADGVLSERTPAADWEAVDTRAPESLIAVSVSSDGHRAVAVGDDGTVVERR